MPEMKTLTIGGTTYTLVGGVTSVNGQTGDVVLDAEDVGAATEQDIADAIIQVLPVDSASGSVASITDGYPAPVEALSVTIKPAQSGSGTPSPGNIRPISGWSEAKVTRSGKNLLNMLGRTLVTSGNYPNTNPRQFDKAYCYIGISHNNYFSNANINSYSIAADGKSITVNPKTVAYGVGFNVDVKPSTTYHLDYSGFAVNNLGVAFYDIDGNYLNNVNINTTGNRTFTTPADCYNIIVVFRPGTANADYTYNLPQLELGSVATTYEAYTAQTVTIDLSGTRYGGTLDVLTGVMTVTHASIDLSTLTWAYVASPGLRFYATISDVKQITGTETANAWCSQYAVGAWNTIAPDNTKDNMFATTSTYITVRDTRYTDAATFKTAMSGVQLVYELAAPLSVQLTPAELSTLLGQNNVWANCGDVAVSYRADIQKYIEKKLS